MSECQLVDIYVFDIFDLFGSFWMGMGGLRLHIIETRWKPVKKGSAIKFVQVVM